MAQAHAHQAGHDAHHNHDAHSPEHYIKIWAFLLVLLVISIAGPEISPYISREFGAMTGKLVLLSTAFGIAFVKAWFVIKHFMHLTDEKPIAWYILITCLVFLVLFLAGVSPDVHNHEGRNWVNVAAKSEIARALEAHAAAERQKHGEVEPQPEVSADVTPPIASKPAFADLTTDLAKRAWLMSRGAEVYVSANCVTCHRANGAGHGPFPPLVGRADNLSDCAKTIGVIRNGMNEAITVGDTRYDLPMPPNPNITNEDAAAVATYIRNSWGNEFGVCNP